MRQGEVWATVLAIVPHIHDRSGTGVDLWVSDSHSRTGRGKIISLEVKPDDPVHVIVSRTG